MSVFLRILRKKEDYKLATLEEKMCIRVSRSRLSLIHIFSRGDSLRKIALRHAERPLAEDLRQGRQDAKTAKKRTALSLLQSTEIFSQIQRFPRFRPMVSVFLLASLASWRSWRVLRFEPTWKCV